MNYGSSKNVESTSRPGASFTIRKMSFLRRLELTQRIRELAGKIEYAEADGGAGDKIESALLATEVDKLYLLWGLAKVGGLEVDGEPATPESLLAAGPEDLCREILAAIKAECGLNEEERKN